MGPIIWRNERWVVFEPERDGQFELRRIENVAQDAIDIPIDFAVWFRNLEDAIVFAQKPLSSDRMGGKK
jgi:hypothetical protein